MTRMTIRRKYNLKATKAILDIDPQGLLDAMRERDQEIEAYRRRRGPTESEIRLARMKRARNMPYEKWVLGEEE